MALTFDTAATDLLCVASDSRVERWQKSLDGHPFSITSAHPKNGLDAALDNAYDVALLDASSFGSPRGLLDVIPAINSAAIYVFLPGNVPRDKLAQIRSRLEQFQAVKNTFVEAPNLQALLGSSISKPPQQKISGPISGGNGRSHPQNEILPSPDPLRIAVWNQAGGVGKTTIASNLAYLAAQRGRQTLLVGLGTPDCMPLLIKGLKKQPNLTGWHSNPTAEGLRAIAQRVSSTLHVVAGFPDIFSEGAFQDVEDSAPASLPNLADTARQEGYSVIIFDVPPAQIAAGAIAAASHLVLVARPTLGGAYSTAIAYQTVVEQLEGGYRIPPENIRVALNQVRRNHGAAPAVWRERIASAASEFPSVTAAIPYFPEVLTLQEQRLLPAQQEERYRQAIAPLANSLFGRPRGENYQGERKFFGLTVRW